MKETHTHQYVHRLAFVLHSLLPLVEKKIRSEIRLRGGGGVIYLSPGVIVYGILPDTPSDSSSERGQSLSFNHFKKKKKHGKERADKYTGRR